MSCLRWDSNPRLLTSQLPRQVLYQLSYLGSSAGRGRGRITQHMYIYMHVYYIHTCTYILWYFYAQFTLTNNIYILTTYILYLVYRKVESLSKMKVLQVACGGYHTLTLVNSKYVCVCVCVCVHIYLYMYSTLYYTYCTWNIVYMKLQSYFMCHVFT